MDAAKASAERLEIPLDRGQKSANRSCATSPTTKSSPGGSKRRTRCRCERVSGYLDKINFVDGAEVKAGDVLLEIDPRPYKAQLDQDLADLKNKKAVRVQKEGVFKRIARLYAMNSASSEDHENLKADFEVAVAAVAQAEAKILQSELNLTWTKVIAQVSGRLSRAMVTKGNLVVADKTQLTSIVSIDPMYAYFYVDERTLQRLRTDTQPRSGANSDQAIIPVEMGLAFEEGYSLKGTLNFEDNRVDNSTGTISMRGVFTNPKLANGARLLSPGMFARVRLTMGSPRRAILISDRASAATTRARSSSTSSRNPRTRRPALPFRSWPNAAMFSSAPCTAACAEIKEAINGVPTPLNQCVLPNEKIVISGLQRIRPGVGVAATDIDMPMVARSAK